MYTRNDQLYHDFMMCVFFCYQFLSFYSQCLIYMVLLAIHVYVPVAAMYMYMHFVPLTVLASDSRMPELTLCQGRNYTIWFVDMLADNLYQDLNL